MSNLLEELRALSASLEAQLDVHPGIVEDHIKHDSYIDFVTRYPWWPALYQKHKAAGTPRKALDEFFSIIWKDEICAACGKKGHKHHPSCRCKTCF